MNLLLLTANFPYFPGEQFLEGEIDILAEAFDKVLIVPLLGAPSKDGKPPRPVPGNVHVFSLPQNLSMACRLRKGIAFHGFVQSIFALAESVVHGRCFLPHKVDSLCRQYINAAARASFIMQNVDLSDYDIFYSYWGSAIGLHLDILKQKMTSYRNRRRLFVARFHGYDLYAERSGLKWLPFQKRLLKCCDVVASCSEQGENYLKLWYPRFYNKIRHYHLGVHAQDACNNGSPDDVLRIVSCSFMVPVKRLELLVRALMRLKRKTVWTHIGDGPERNKISSLVAQLPSHVSSVFLGHLEHADVPEFYRRNPVDVFVNVSSSEGIPVSIMEALSFGIEPIATDVGGVSELVKSEFGTLLRPDFHPAELTDILEKYQRFEYRRIEAQHYQRRYFSTTNYRKFASDLIAAFRGD